MMSAMTEMNPASESPANTLCKACGLCCTGHLFVWTKLRSPELDAIEALGVNVIRSVPSQRGFNQPCPLWQGQCTVYDTPQYPRFCRTYKCKLLKNVLEEGTSLPEALKVIEHAKRQIQEVETLLPASQNPNLRERLANYLESVDDTHPDLQRKAEALLRLYEHVFGINDIVE
jgi:hypothetical protein